MEESSNEEDQPLEQVGQEVHSTFELNFCDFLGDPIECLNYRITLEGSNFEAVVEGLSDGDGKAEPVSNIPLGTKASIAVKNDEGEYSEVGDVVLDGLVVTTTAVSPKIKLEMLPLEQHDGEPGAAKGAVPRMTVDNEVTLQKPPNQEGNAAKPSSSQPAASVQKQKKIDRNVNQPRLPALKARRDEKGNPVLVVEKKTGDWYEDAAIAVRAGIHWLWSWLDFKQEIKNIPTYERKPTQGSIFLKNPPAAAEKLKRLIEVATENTNIYITDSSTTVLANMVNGRFDREKYALKRSNLSKGQCARYVNIALRQADVTTGLMELPYGSVAGPQLIAMGFVDVTAMVPDGRWAATGDIIVYRWSDATWEERKERKYQGRSVPNYGHIEIRSDEDYISDYIPGPGGPAWGDYINIRIYRKIFDLTPMLRIKAFLRCLREYECQAERDDAKRYGMLNTPLPGNKKTFSEFDMHPWQKIPEYMRPKSTAAGAYQILRTTWEGLILSPKDRRIVPLVGQALFDPLMQDRIAVALLEGGKALGDVRVGRIADAVNKLKGVWSSLPGGRENSGRRTSDGRSMDIEYFKELFEASLAQERQREGV